MKQTKHILLMATMLLCSLATSAHDFEVDGIYYNVTNATDLTVAVTYKGGNSYEYSNEYNGEVIIPSTVTCESKTYTVTSIGDYAFYDCSSLTSITIPEGVTSIGSYAFYRCSSLVSATIPEGITSLPEYAFQFCSSLESLSLPESLTTIGHAAVSHCFALKDLKIPDNVHTIGNYAFDQNGFTAIVIPGNVTSIGVDAFYNCSGLTSITSEAETPPTIGSSNTFYDVDKSIPVYVPFSSVEAYQSAEFWNEFTNIQPIPDIASGTCGDGLTWRLTGTGRLIIGGTGAMTDYSFSGIGLPANTPWREFVDSIKSVVIEEGVNSIGTYAFYYCSSLVSATIPEGITSLPEYAFQFCSSLESLSLPESLTTIGHAAVSHCFALKDLKIPDNVHTIGNYAFDQNGFTAIVIPGNVTSIGVDAFYNCSGLTSITSEAETPPTIGSSNTFYNVDKSIPVYVPINSIADYQAAEGWKEFTNFVGEETGIDTTTIDNSEALGLSKNGQQATVIYDLTGRRVTDAEVLKGIYIVNGRKVVIK